MSHGRFFATGADLRLVTDELEAKLRVNYTLMGHYPSHDLLTVESASLLPGFGKADGDQTVACSSYLVTLGDAPLHTRRIQRRDGSVIFIVDQGGNLESVAFTPAGFWEDGSIISGRVATMQTGGVAGKLLRRFGYLFNKHFVKVQTDWVGPQALTAMRNGTRLCDAIQSPWFYDLREHASEAAEAARLAAEKPGDKPSEVLTLEELMARLTHN